MESTKTNEVLMETKKTYTLDELAEMIADSNRMLRTLLNEKQVEKIMSVSDISRLTGYSRTTLYSTKRYMIPNFGVSGDIPGRYPKWYKSTVDAWISKGEIVLSAEYEQFKREQNRIAN